ncbi:MAG: DUF5989 family protein [Pirellulaceae bacterium]|nr:DUF5989 family protein [Pirellulaceae bacterium]
MTGESSNSGEPPRRESLAEQAQQHQPGLLRELLEFLIHEKKWWLIPIVIVLLALGLLVVLGSTGAAPFIYTVF